MFFFWITIVSLLLLLLVVFPFTRKMVIWLFGPKGPLAIAVGWIWAVMMHVIQAHIVVARNFLPRQMILPSLEKKSTKGD